MKKFIFAIGVSLIIYAAGIAGAQQFCLQDQYGNQYNFDYDPGHFIMFGSMTSGEGCDALTWELTGSVALDPLGSGAILELTVANPLGDGDAVCVSSYKLKGTLPCFEWYYPDVGPGGQPSCYVSCGTPVTSADQHSGGTLR